MKAWKWRKQKIKHNGKLDYPAILYCRIRGIKNIIPYKKTCFIIDKTAHVQVNGALFLNDNSIISNGRSTILRMDKEAQLIVTDEFRVYYGGDIICFPNSILKLGSGFFNSGVKIRCKDKITIGNGVFISHDVTIMDSDAHKLSDRLTNQKAITIEDHVWIGSRTLILKGVHIGEGAVIGAGSVVNRDIPAHSLAAGNPARVIRRNISWN